MSWRARVGPHINSIFIVMNPKDPNCYGARNWWRLNLPELQILNPYVQFSIQELSFGEPHMIVRYTAMDQRMVRLAGSTEEEMEDIMEACATYGINHSLSDDLRADDANPTANRIINFGYTESFIAKLDVKPQCDLGQNSSEGVEDPGQKPRQWPRHPGLKVIP